MKRILTYYTALLSLLFSTVVIGHETLPVIAHNPTLWIAGSNGFLKVNVGNFENSISIQTVEKTTAIGIDSLSGKVWVQSGNKLLSYDIAGHLLSSLDISTASSIGFPSTQVTELLVNPHDGQIWLAASDKLYRFTNDGGFIGYSSFPDSVKALALASENANIWAAIGHSIYQLSPEGQVVSEIPLNTSQGILDIAFDESSETIWVALTDTLRRYSTDGSQQFDTVFTGIDKLDIDADKGLWVSAGKSAFYLNFSSSTWSNAIVLSGSNNANMLDMVIGTNGSAWFGNHKIAVNLSPTGQKLQEFNMPGNQKLFAMAMYQDKTLPIINVTSPIEGDLVDFAATDVALTFSDSGIGVDESTLKVFLDGAEVDVSCLGDESGHTCSQMNDYSAGQHELSVTVVDFAGNESLPSVINFTVSPVNFISVTSVSLTNQPSYTLTGKLYAPATMTVNGTPVTVDSNNNFTAFVALQEGVNTLSLEAVTGTSSYPLAFNVELDTIAPIVDPEQIRIGFEGTGLVSVIGETGSVEPGATIEITNPQTGETIVITANSDGSFYISFIGAIGDVVHIRVLDRLGNTNGPFDKFVADIIAPTLDPTKITTPFAATEFIHTGNYPVQIGVTEGTVKEEQVASIHGVVKDINGQPISGVKVSIHNHQEYGYTLTRNSGQFDLVVNGGAHLTLSYEKQGYFPVHRLIETNWQQFAAAEDVVMLQPDPAGSLIDLALMAPMQLAVGPDVTDAAGTRHATVMFPQGTTAEMEFNNGSRQALTSFTLRMTEYSKGDDIGFKLPATLPENVSNASTIEFSVDEALAAGATSVHFNQPVSIYVNNYLELPVGSAVPNANYNRQQAQWVGTNNGLIIKILSIVDGIAELDTDGSGIAADAATLIALGITDAERQQLAVQYSAGDSLWRSVVNHFTPITWCWPYGAPDGTTAPDLEELDEEEPENCEQEGSIIECQNQILGETVRLTGSPFTLNYRNSRTEGRKSNYRVEIPLRGASINPKVTRIFLKIRIASKVEEFEFQTGTNSYTYEWDGRDSFGRKLYGAQQLYADVGYAYEAKRMPALSDRLISFREIAGSVDYLSSTKELEIVVWQKLEFEITRFLPQSANLGAWTLNIHHQYDPAAQMLYLGDGSRRAAIDRNRIIETVAGTGVRGYSGDSELASNAELAFPKALDIAQNGDLYIADAGNNVIRKVDKNGIITTVAGNGSSGFSGDGGLATQAQLYGPEGVAVHPDGSIFISDGGNNRIRKVDPNGIITTYAGTGNWDYGGDGGLAINAHFNWPQNIKLGKDGSLFVADYWNFRIRRIDPNGLITTVAGGDEWGNGYEAGDGDLATAYGLDFPQAATPDSQGNLLIADSVRALVRKVTADGIINTLAGQIYSTGTSDEGEIAVNAKIVDPYDIDVDQEDNIYFVDFYSNCIKKISNAGILSTYAGKCNPSRYGYAGDGGFARDALLDLPWSVAVAPDGSVYIAEPYNNVIRRVHQAFPMFDSDDYAIASENDEELFQFDKTGRHLKTWNTTTGHVIYNFSYDSAGYLTQVTDQDGKVTTIYRNAIGEPVSIVAPHGQITSLSIDPNGYLASIANPLDQKHQFTYTPDGLLLNYTNPRLKSSTFSFDADGRLESDLNAVLGGWTLARTKTSSGHSVDMTTAEGRKLEYQVIHLLSGDKQWINTNKDGTQVTSLFKTDGETITTMPSGNIVSVKKGPDPRFSIERPIRKKTIQTPSGLLYSSSETRTAALSNPDHWFSHTQLTSSNNTNGRVSSSVFDVATRTWTLTSPEGRQAQMQVDASNHPTSFAVPGIEPITYFYNSDGYLASTSQGNRSSQFNYHESGHQSGYLAMTTDSLGRESTFSYFPSGEIATALLPGNRDISYHYDANLNTTGVTPPGKPEHEYSYSEVDLVDSYSAPAVTGIQSTTTQYEYNLDKQLEAAILPDARVLDYEYAPDSGRLTTLSIPRGQYSYHYNTATGQLEEIIAPDNGTLSYQYDGNLLLASIWGGEITGSVSQVYNNDFVITERRVNGAEPVSFTYDNDLLLISAGSLSISRDPLNGLITGTELGSVSTSMIYNSFADPNKVSALFGTNLIFDTGYSYDDLGRIIQKVEFMEGASQTITYSYDAAGRLTEVKTNGVVTEAYGYDANGNRLTATVAGLTVSGGYDAQDRLNQYGNLSYIYTNNGELASVTDTVTSEVTLYSYDVLSNLVSATLPDLTKIDFVIDGQNRRIGKKLNGTLVQGFLYQDQLNPVAELDGQGNLVSRFVYGSEPFVPNYMLKGGRTYRIISDHLGSVRLVMDSVTGDIVQRIDYDSFGNILSNTNPGFQPFAYAGGLYDEHLAITRFGARDYDAKTGRWLTKDPIGFSGGLNNYLYVNANPVSYIDPQGKSISVAVGTWIANDVAIPEPSDLAWPKWIAYGVAFTAAVTIDSILHNDEHPDGEPRCPTGSKPINETDWSGDHDKIKKGINAGATDNTQIDPNDNVWGQNPDGSWTNYGPAGMYTGSGNPSGRKGKNRGRR
jgi:RHS repeat-associated protein